MPWRRRVHVLGSIHWHVAVLFAQFRVRGKDSMSWTPMFGIEGSLFPHAEPQNAQKRDPGREQIQFAVG